MSKKQQEQEIIETNDTLQTQIDASISVARSLVESWLPPPKPGDKIEDTEDDTKTKEEYSTGRPERLGLGAKFLSHKEATRHQGNSKQEIQLRNKILNQNQRKRKDESGRKRRRPQDDDDDDDNEEDSRTAVVQDTKKPTDTDFLSAIMNERANKKSKKKKNKKSKQQQQQQNDDNDNADI